MLAPALRNPCFNLYILAALIAAPTIFRCHAHPLRDDLARSDTTHSLGTRADDSPPPAYDFQAPGEQDTSDSDSDSDSDDNNNVDNEIPPDYKFLVETLEVDEEGGTAKINGFKDVFLQPNPVELGKNDREGISRKYYIVDPNHAEDEVEKPAVLKIIDLVKAERLDENAPGLLVKEGEYWGKGKGNMFLWQTDEPIEQLDRHGRVVKREYMVMYRATRTGLVFDYDDDEDSDPHLSTPLKFIGEWSLEWKTETEVDYMLGQCKYTAMKTHKSLAEQGMEIDDYNLNKWVTDERCKYWLPNEINAAFSYRKKGKKALVRGAKKLELKSERDYNRHFQNVQEELDSKFTVVSVREHIDKLSAIKAVELSRRPG